LQQGHTLSDRKKVFKRRPIERPFSIFAPKLKGLPLDEDHLRTLLPARLPVIGRAAGLRGGRLTAPSSLHFPAVHLEGILYVESKI
jgi:hypothetical protein